LPDDTAALVDQIRPDGLSLTLVNVNPVHDRTVILQMGAYGEHHCTAVEIGGRRVHVDGPRFRVRLAAGTGARLDITTKRYAHQPSLALPW
jgi:hypothetical protein